MFSDHGQAIVVYKMKNTCNIRMDQISQKYMAVYFYLKVWTKQLGPLKSVLGRNLFQEKVNSGDFNM